MADLPAFYLVKPVDRSFVVNDRFNAPRNYTFAPTKKQLHEGIDLAAIDARGQPVAVFAAQRGVVNLVGFSAQGYGNYVRILHEWGDQTYVTWYGHLSAVTVKQGDFVLAGQKIGMAGTTGFSSGIHLHLTLQHIGHGLKGYVVDDVVDPEPYFRLAPEAPFDELSFLADVTIPDGTVLAPGQAFAKTWRVRNTGTRTWDAGYRLVFAGHDPLGGPPDVALPVVPVAPGQTLNLTVPLIAPAQPGTYRSVWQLRNPAGVLIPRELFAEIKVQEVRPIDLAVFVADVTVEDGTVLQPGTTFVKTWRVRNAGTTQWAKDYTLRHVGDHRMNGPDAVALGREVKPGQTVTIAVTLTAPDTPGRHRSTWMLHNSAGQRFEHDLYAEIQVPQQLKPNQKLSEMRWLADVTIPDETEVQPGARFIKTWRVRNTGQTTWGPGYVLAFFGDEQMGGPENVPLPAAKPGDAVELSVPLIAPQAPGLHRSTWKGRDPKGRFFEFDMFALIKVPDVQRPAQDLDELSFVADVTVPDGTVMRPGEAFVKTWRVRNTGTTAWGAGYALAYWGDHKMEGPEAVSLPVAKPGETVELSLMLTAPAQPGLHKSTWKARNAEGRVFEHELFALIEVFDPAQVIDMLEYLRGDGRVYDLQFDWHGGGRQRVQTQVEGNRFYHVKYSEWEELWADEFFIYRGTDTSPGGGEVYTLTENGQYGSPWVPRKMAIGVPFRRTPQVEFRNKQTGAEVPGKRFTHVTWIVLEAVHGQHTLPNGVTLRHVAVLAAYEDEGGKPKAQPFERYYYAKGYGLVGWEGALGRSLLVEEFARGAVPDNTRERLDWLARLRD